MIERLFNNLAPALNRDPQSVDAISISSNTEITFVVKDGFIQVGTYASYNLSSYTILNLVQQLNTISGIQAISIAYGSLSALALVDGTYTMTKGVLKIFTSPLWQFSMPIAQELKKIEGQSINAFFQASPQTSSGVWLDSLGNLYGITRQPGEPDTLFAIRVFDFSLAPRVNAIAIKKILTDLGYTVEIVNTAPAPAFQVTVSLPSNPPEGFIYSVDQLGTLVNQLKAEGVTSKVLLQGQFSDSFTITENLASTLSSTKPTYSSGKWGQMSWA